MTSNVPIHIIARRAAGRIIAGWLDQVPGMEAWEVARVVGEVADEVQRDDLVCDSDSTATGATIAAVASLADELRYYCEWGPNPTPEAYRAACAALDRHRRRADDAEAARQDLADEHTDLLVHVARLRQFMASHGLEDPTWRSLNARQKQVLRDADAEALARVAR